ncbi:MAG: FGGY-family carbohydrate kinase [Acidimicrobiia bacterium]|nr:FGGY-family carbohydrate kinase [Acidimicrobiia bacterium]
MTVPGQVLVVDVGTSSVRATVVDGDARVVLEHRAPLLPDSPTPGLVEFDAVEMARLAIELATSVLEAAGPVAGVGIANQRASTVVWDRTTGTPVAPGLGWQDLRTLGRCLELAGAGRRIAPNHTATKVEYLLDLADPDRSRDLCVGTVDTWIAWTLSGGALHVSDATNAQVTALRTPANDAWSDDVLATLRIPAAAMPRVVDSTGIVGEASALPGAPPIAGIIGDQQGSLLGQGCVHHCDAKATFGTGGMLDVVIDGARPEFDQGRAGTFPIVTRRTAGVDAWGLEAVMLAAGTNVEWLRDDLELIASVEESDAVAAACADTGDVWFVPAPFGLGAPHWDYGARSALLGLTRGTERAQVVRAVLEGVAHRGTDLIEAAEVDARARIERLKVDGGMSTNTTFLQALADVAQRPVEVAPVREATSLGAAFCAGLAVGLWDGDDDLAATWRPARVIEPGAATDRDRWREAVARSEGWVPALSALKF